MDSKITEASKISSPLLPGEGKRHSGSCSVPSILILSTLVAVSGSYVFGSAVSSHLHPFFFVGFG